jgi:ubiquinone/menaquinone biosynthesis C-methylase UbiE
MKRTRSIQAYDIPERVASYDANMELMHPNRAKMVAVALEVMPFPEDAALNALDLGIGTGYFTLQFLRRYPHARVVAVDGAEAMIELARQRLGDLSGWVTFCIGDFRDLGGILPGGIDFDVIYSSYALHHLSRQDKVGVIRQAGKRLQSPGWFLNADLIVAEDPAVEKRIQEIRTAGIVERAAGQTDPFRDVASTRRFLESLEAKEGDQPLALLEDLRALQEAGLQKPAVFWLEYREAVTGGVKST